MDAKLEGGCRFESCCAYLDEKHMAATAERSLIYRFESCPDYKKIYMKEILLIKFVCCVCCIIGICAAIYAIYCINKIK